MQPIGLPMVERTCGECTACCTAVAVQELGKPYYVKCEHLKHGCSLHPNHPASCQKFFCAWLTCAPVLKEKHRPDKFGAVFLVELDERGQWLDVFLTRDMNQKDMRKVIDVAITVYESTQNPFVGIRVYKNNTLVPVAFPIDGTKYPTDNGGRRNFVTFDNVIYITTDPPRTKAQKRLQEKVN